MNWKTSDIIEGTVLLILVGIIVRHSIGVSQVINALGANYVNAIKALNV